MGSLYLTDLADVCRVEGLEVVEMDGWQTRARGSGGYEPGRPTHVMVHHTASPPSASGEPDANYCTHIDEDAPLCNLYLDRTGLVWVCAAGATNTNGKGSDWWGGGVPDDSMNSYAIGIEANGGYGSEWPMEQQAAYTWLIAALCDSYGIDRNCVRGHFEWAPTRKVDPAGPSQWSPDDSSWDMDAFRRACGTEEETDMPLSDDDIARIADAVWRYEFDTTQGSANIDPQPARYWLQRAYLIVAQYLGGFSGHPAKNPTMLKEIHDNTKK